MRKILTALVASAIVGATALAASSPANAWGWGWPFYYWGGMAAGVIVGGALVAPYHYGPYAYYVPYPYYGSYPYPYYYQRCATVWNGYTWVSSCY